MTRPIHLLAALVLTGSLSAGCGDDGGGAADAAPGELDGAASDANLADAGPAPDANIYPPSLRDTGLYSDFDNRVVASDVFEYEVNYPLWSDGADKRRWVHIPAGTQIDTSNMDLWVYPEGTKLWKEFSSGNLLLETRLLWKKGPTEEDWVYVSYGWNMDQDEATEMPDGAVDVLGTDFDIPDQRNCSKCHQRTPDFVLGFAAIQLDHSQAGVTLDSLVTDSLLTNNPNGMAPYYTVPGDAEEQAVLGYFHGNCGGCHNPSSDVMDSTALNMRLEVGKLNTVAQTTAYSTIVGVPPQLPLGGATSLIEEGDPSASAIFLRMNMRGTPLQMPPRGTEVLDTDFMAILSSWIMGLN